MINNESQIQTYTEADIPSGLSEDDKVRLLRDPKFYLENFCKIKGKEPGLIPFKLNEAQKDLFNALNTSKRVIILKARQIGFSTAVTGYFYHKAITTPGFTAALVGYNSDMTTELLEKVKMFLQTAPPELRPNVQYNSKYEISFPATNSKILVLPATDNVGRGYTLHAVLLTELPMWEGAEEKMVAIENSVPLDGQIVIESTPKGVGNVFHRMWMDKDNGYVKKEYGWWWGYSEEEIEVIRKRMNNPMKFAQEYELEFLSTGRNVFDIEIIHKMRRNILQVGQAHTDPDGQQHVVQQEPEKGLIMYEQPKADRLYVIGADVAEGVTGGDYSVCSIWDRTSGRQVGYWRGHLPADKFGEKLNEWGRKYNNALMVVEINNHGLTTVTKLKDLLYPTMYFRPAKFDAIASAWSDRLGWKTTRVTRPIMIDDLAQAFRDGNLTPRSQDLLDEMTTFVFDKGNNMVPLEGYHDDIIFSAAIGLQGFKVLYDKPLDQLDYSHHLQIPNGY